MENVFISEFPKSQGYNLPEGWRKVKIRNIAKVTSGGTPDRSKAEFWNGSIPWITTSLIDLGVINKAEEYITDKGLTNSSTKIFPVGTLLIAMYGQGKTRGKVAILGIKAATNQACAAILLTDFSVDNQYLYYNLQSRYSEIRNISNTGNQENLNGELIKLLPVKLPPFAQQRKIAAILLTWDEAIQAADQLLKAKQKRKLGLMQQVLTGQKRLPGFSGEWREVHFDEILREVKRPVKWNDDELYHLISVRRRSGGVFFRESLLGSQILTKNLRTAKAGEFLMSKMQIVHGASGLVRKEHDGMKISGSYIAVISRDLEVFDIEFFDWYSQLKSFYRLCYTSSYGVHIEKMTFNFVDFLKRKILIPPTVDEQRAITEVLNAADDEIRLATAEVEVLKQQKRGLMQQLLTGQKLVTVDEQERQYDLLKSTPV